MRCFFRLVLIALWALPLPARSEPLVVFAAASLSGTLDEITAQMQTPARLSFGGSGSIARQISQGAPADVVILAHADWMDWLNRKGLLKAAPTPFAANRLVLIAPRQDAIHLPVADADTMIARLQGGRLALGQRDAVPAGQYAQEWLKEIGAWHALLPHLVETESVRSALALVARAEAPLGIVYASDAQAEPRVSIVHDVPVTDHSPIRLLAAALTEAGDPFVRYLTGDTAQNILRTQGFIPLPAVVQ